jgi:hypothetical protein
MKRMILQQFSKYGYEKNKIPSALELLIINSDVIEEW